MGSMCGCKAKVDGTPQLAISQGVQVSLYRQQDDGSFALLEPASANNYFVANPGAPVAWRADDGAMAYACGTKSNVFTLLQSDPLREHFLQGVQDPELSGDIPRFSQGLAAYLSTTQGSGTRGPTRPQTVNSPAGWTNPGYIVNHVGSTFASTTGASGAPLIATNYGDWGIPTFPPTVQIVSIGLLIKVAVDLEPDVFDAGIYLTLDGSTPVGNDQSHSPTLEPWCPSGSATQETRGYGAANTSPYVTTQPLWGLPSVSIADIDASTFGVMFLMKSNSGLGQGYILDWELTVGFVTAANHVYQIRKSSAFGVGPLNKTAIIANTGPVGMQDTSRLRPGATVQVSNPNLTCGDNWYSTWAGVGGLAPPPSHPRPTTKTSPGTLCTWSDPTLVAYLPNSEAGPIVCWSGDDFVIAPPEVFGVSATTYSGPFCYSFDGTAFTLATIDTLTLPSSNPSGWSVGANSLFAADGVHAAVVVGSSLYLAQRSGTNLGSWSQFAFVGVDIGDVNHTIATAQASVFDISADGGLLAFRATNGGSLAERIHVYNAGGSVLAVLVPASITRSEQIKQIKFSDDVATGNIALAVCTDDGSLTGRTSVFTSADSGSTWVETWQHSFPAQGAAFAHGYRVP